MELFFYGCTWCWVWKQCLWAVGTISMYILQGNAGEQGHFPATATTLFKVWWGDAETSHLPKYEPSWWSLRDTRAFLTSGTVEQLRRRKKPGATTDDDTAFTTAWAPNRSSEKLISSFWYPAVKDIKPKQIKIELQTDPQRNSFLAFGIVL